MIKEISGVILAGGKNSRMGGEHKAFLDIQGKPIIFRQIEELSKVFSKIYVIVNNRDNYRQIPDKVIILEDRIKDIGPIGGIYTGLMNLPTEAAFFLACDMPKVHNGVIELEVKEYLKTDYDCFIAECRGKKEPLHSIYSKKIIPIIKECINKGDYRLMNLISKLNAGVYKVGDDLSNIFNNINTPNEFKNFHDDI